MASFDASTPTGLLAILEEPPGKWALSRVCAAVEECVLANR